MYLKAPSTVPVGANVILADGSTRVVDAAGGITVANGTPNNNFNILPLLSAGWVIAEEDQALPPTLFTPDANAAAHTLALAAMGPGRLVTVNLTGALAAGAALTLPTVALLVAQLGGFAVAGFGYRLRLINSSAGAFAWTVTTAAGWTLAGTMTVAQNTFRDFDVTFQSVAAATLQQVGTGSTS
jgi:hypothetical protein